MQYDSLEELIGLPEEEAIRLHLLARNYRRLCQFAGAAALLAFVILLFYLVEGNYRSMVAPVILLALSRWIFAVGDREYLRRHFRIVLVALVLTQSLLLAVAVPSIDEGARLVGFLVSFIVPTFRLRTLDYAILLVSLWLLALSQPLIGLVQGTGSPSMPQLVIQTLVAAVALYLGVSTTQQDQLRFLRRFKIESSRNRERLRMRQELDYARQIQLSMLPRRDPKIPGLDVAAVSLPATEVGGDYYEYFPGDDSRLRMVVGDVAGHGVASGLLLSGIRSCLHLLHEDNPPPVEILGKLDRMVRQTTDRRMFITLLYALLEPTTGRLLVSTAGHPPVLHYRAASGDVAEVGASAPPLGTRLDPTFIERTADVASGDVLLFHTDGLSETINQAGDLYGNDRLAQRFARAARQKSARDIREAVLSDLWNFKGDAEQLDDITMVVVRIQR